MSENPQSENSGKMGALRTIIETFFSKNITSGADDGSKLSVGLVFLFIVLAYALFMCIRAIIIIF